MVRLGSGARTAGLAWVLGSASVGAKASLPRGPGDLESVAGGQADEVARAGYAASLRPHPTRSRHAIPQAAHGARLVRRAAARHPCCPPAGSSSTGPPARDTDASPRTPDTAGRSGCPRRSRCRRRDPRARGRGLRRTPCRTSPCRRLGYRSSDRRSRPMPPPSRSTAPPRRGSRRRTADPVAALLREAHRSA